ncbi:NADP-dependent oxidoreductase [Micromonospora olivasterospora]|uniref:Zinc-binding dehydrogenase n=1 Tax=Micromonospora olivasterospora TaxID=1880 RepID=A0A562IHR3_MICOL|nr:NADP-dependent oxidoreductase [Micromonospora olivasterospora]TWH70432.1 zinc-binding dehydrogenase [Micromonospora olivasterospora]
MRAVAVANYSAQPTIMELPDPRAGHGEVLVGIRAAGVNPIDLSIANGEWAARGADARFPLIMGIDMAGVVEAAGEHVTRFAPGDAVFGQLFLPPLGSTGTYAEQVAVPEEANLARVPPGMDLETAAALPTAGGTALNIADGLGPLPGETVLVVGAAGGVGSFLTQLLAASGARVLTVARADAADRLRAYGAAENFDRAAVSVPDAVGAACPDGIGVLVDLASEAPAFAELATLVRVGGTALSTRYAADVDDLAEYGISGINFRVNMTPDLLARLADAVVTGQVAGPPIRTVRLDDVPSLLGRPSVGAAGDKIVVLPGG